MVGSTVPSVTGIDAGPVSEWLREHDDASKPPYRFELIAGGHSNLTYRVTDANGTAYALRRPPLGHVLATAHDMGREFRIVSALQSTSVPVAPLVGLCTDDTVNGSPFYVMRFVDGVVMRNREIAADLSPAIRSRASMTLIDTLADIHEVDVDAVGLGDLGRKDGYIARQLKRWRTQFHDSKTREIPEIDEVHDLLVARVPEQQGSGIVHGDYRLDNCIFGPGGDVRAVLDWELCTLGDVLADLAQLLIYWGEPGDDHFALDSPPSAEPGFASRADLIARYAERSERDLSQLDYYMAFASWKVACILEGVYSRYVAGAMGDRATGQDISTFIRRVDHLSSRAATIARAL
jgi:aminoglycoside phosphotransferase (APT) family kinase protein